MYCKTLLPRVHALGWKEIKRFYFNGMAFLDFVDGRAPDVFLSICAFLKNDGTPGLIRTISQYKQHADGSIDFID